MSQWDDLIQAAGQKYNVDPRLIASVVQVESSGDPAAYNASTGAAGLGQQIPDTARRLGIDPKDPAQSIDGAARLLDENLRRYGNAEQAVLAYHGGTDQSNWGPKTQAYLGKVAAQYAAPAAIAPDSIPDAFEKMFGPRPLSAEPSKNALAKDPFEAMFGPRPKPAAPQAAAPFAPAAEGQQVAPAQNAASPLMPKFLSLALGENNYNAAQGVAEGLNKAGDAPSEWLSKALDASGLTGALRARGVDIGSEADQIAANQARREQFDEGAGSTVSGKLGDIGGQIGGVLVPLVGAENAAVQGGRALSSAIGNPQALSAAGAFLRGQSGLLSRMLYGAGQGAAGGVLLSGGQPDTTLGESAGLGAALGGAIPVVGAAGRYLWNSGRSLVAPFTESGRARIAQRAVQAEAAKDPLNQAQNLMPETAGTPASSAAANASAPAVSQVASPVAPVVQPSGVQINARFNAPAATQSGSAPVAANASTAVQQATADDALARAAAAGRIEANFDELVPGSQPTLAQATGNAGIAALERAAMSRQPNAFAERQLANYAARNAYLTEIRGTPQTLEDAVIRRDKLALPILTEAMKGRSTANARPVVEEIDKILATEAGQRDDVVRALTQVRNKIDRGAAEGLQDDALQLYGIHKSIDDQLTNVSGRDNSAAQLAAKELLQVKRKLEGVIEKAAPDFRSFLRTYAELSRPINAQTYLQKLDLTDQTSNRITLNKVKSELLKIERARARPGANDAKSISDEQLSMLRNLHTDLQREAHSSRGMALGSNTFQNFATNQLIDSMLPGRLGVVAPVTPGALGGVLGLALGGNVGAGIGAVGGQQLGGIASRAMNAQGPEIEARLIDYLLNPNGAEVLRRASAIPGSAELLLRRTAPVAPSAIGPGTQGNR